MPLKSLKLEEMSDRELLWVVHDLQGEDGARTSAIAAKLGIVHKYPVQCVGTRLGYMRSKGLVDREFLFNESHYTVTAAGEQVMKGKLTTSQTNMINRLSEGDMIMLMRHVTGRYGLMDTPMATVMRREWQRGSKR